MKTKNIRLLLDITSNIMIVSCVVYLLYRYQDMPSQLPTHYNLSGQVDGVGSKSSIWALVVIMLILHIGIGILNRYPKIFNYPVKLKGENRKLVYQMAQLELASLRILTDVIFTLLIIIILTKFLSTLFVLMLAIIGFPLLIILFTILIKRINNK